MKVDTDPQKIEELLTRSIDTIYPTRNELEKKLKGGVQLRVYMGIDPTNTYVHLGHTTNYIILRRLHELGHKIIVLIGDFTATIGDPSDKTAARRRLTQKEVENNLKGFKMQIGKILDFADRSNPIEFRFNSEWLAKLTLQDAVELASNFTVQQMIERDVFGKRIAEKKPLYVHEFFYPLMQGYDSVALEADVEVGGTDQTFNMLAGRTLVKKLKNREKFVLATTLLENPKTGEKLMSKGKGTGIGLNEDPASMFGKIMALPDETVIQCLIDCTYLSMPEIQQLEKEISKHPKEVKVRLAKEIVAMYHGKNAAEQAAKDFEQMFSQGKAPSEISVITLPRKNFTVMGLVMGSGFISSKSEARRLVLDGAVEIEGVVKRDPEEKLSGDELLIRVGKHRFIKIKRDKTT